MSKKKNNITLNDNIFKCSLALEEKGYKYTTEGLFCPLVENIYLKIGRTNNKYSYSLVKYENLTFNYMSSTYTCKEPITEEKDSRTKKLNQYWAKVSNNTSIEPILSTIAIDLLNETDFTQINATFDTYEKEKQKTAKEDSDSIDYEIEGRRNPKLNPISKNEAKQVEDELKSIGFVKYLEKHLDKLHKGNHTNMYRKLLGAFKIMRAEGSYIFETIAKAGEGKSLEDDIVFSLIIPPRYIYKVNSITKSSFTRYSDKNPNYFDRMILLFGDFGSRKSFNQMEELLNILKVLITEKEYVRDLSDKTDDGNYDNKKLTLKCDSIGGVYSSVINDFTNGDSQLESRTISSTPYGAKEEEIMDFMILLEYKDSTESKEKQEAEKELKKFQKYLLSLVNKEMTIVNPYGNIFKRYAIHGDVPKRELKQVLELFDAYCKLTYFNCDEVNGHMVASEEQLNEFMKEICLENALIPYESDFLKMIIAKEKDTELTIINTDDENETDDKNNSNPLTKYYKNILKQIKVTSATSFSDLNKYLEEQAVKQLLKLYKLGGTSSEHKENVFFRISDIRRQYSKYKAYKNIDDVQTLIHRLVKKGYIDSLEYQDKKQSIYYLTSQCNDIAIPFELTEEDKESAKEFLKKVGVIE